MLFVICNLDRGGTETQVVELAKRLTSSQCLITVAALQGHGSLRAELAKAGIRIVDFPKVGGLVSVRGAHQFLRLVRFIRKEQFDVVHSHDLWANLIAVPAARLAGAPLVFSSQRDLAHLYWYTPSRLKVISRIHRWADGVIVNSAAVKDMVQHRFLVPAARIHLVHNGIDFERFSSAHADRKQILPMLEGPEKLFLTVANMHSAVKGHFELIDAAKSVVASHPEARFVLVGDGTERENIENSAKQTAVHSFFLFLGQRHDIPDLLSCCDVFVLPSRAEGLPNSILEAMAAGLPVVATSVGGIPEIIEDQITGILVPPQDPDALAGALLKMLGNHGLAGEIATAGRRRARERFSFERAVAELRSIYGISGATS
ncbi:MAG TPA: glycosyltransferase [Candidatus Sulfotelmatobacter sp.]|nr:glycosyltransferase [Candidatus Sulfotelmatobacter sp.]